MSRGQGPLGEGDIPRHVDLAPAEVGRSLRVLLVAEGTYPYHPGGVSLWCDQIIRGMPENSFTVVSLTVDGTEPQVWPSPDNLTRVVNLPMWAAPSQGADRQRPPPSVVEAHENFLRTLLRPPQQDPHYDRDIAESFLFMARTLFDYAKTGDVRSVFVSNDALDRLTRAWREADGDGQADAAGRGATLTLYDAFTAADLMEHALRPLSRPPIDADVCHLAMCGSSVLVGLTSKWAYGTPLVMSEHGVYLRERYMEILREPQPSAGQLLMLRFCRAMTVAAYRAVDVLAPHSQYNRRWQLYGGADPARIRTMYNGIDPADYPVAEAEPDVPTMVFVGRIDPLKDLHTLIRAFALVRREVPEARLRIFGPVPRENKNYHASCLALVEELGLSGAAVFEGRVPRQADAYQAGHLTALTSVSEGFPYTVVESMSMGRPQVCTNVGGVSEAVGDAGILVPPGDQAAVAQACVRLLRDAGLRRRLGTAARERVLEKFTLSQWNDGYRKMYDDLVLSPHSGPRRVAGRERAAIP
ncbi:GT4 family glycosyltransferase PelF [Streptomyces coacervatus]|uniref:GT4 family glycosyltransferase PelF n=1 Tax=Streptomyces coacervatus TaxID=647381 RepID=UPI0023DBA7C2|nr:GT4 family glycosyltransferase PelF [Streptomyces coacervatus]MDF2269603.1 GT4 family glycosyltransferase PelF [Streptomyces coacervatus]